VGKPELGISIFLKEPEMVGKSSVVAGFALALSLLGSAQGAVNVLLNGDFELPTTVGQFPTSWTSWTGRGPALDKRTHNSTNPTFYNPTGFQHGGNLCYAEVAGNINQDGGIFQLVTGLIPGVTYTYSGFWEGGDSGHSFHETGVFKGAKTAAQLDAAGGDLANIGGLNTGISTWQSFTRTFVLPAGFTSVTVYTKLGNTATEATMGTWYDDLTLTPEPASALLLACGGLVVLRRRRLA
jgi:hypothetical protein